MYWMEYSGMNRLTFFPAVFSTMAPSRSDPGLAMVHLMTSCGSYGSQVSSWAWNTHIQCKWELEKLIQHSISVMKHCTKYEHKYECMTLVNIKYQPMLHLKKKKKKSASDTGLEANYINLLHNLLYFSSVLSFRSN